LGEPKDISPAPKYISASDEFMKLAFESTFGKFEENWNGDYSAINIQQGGLQVLERSKVKYSYIFLGDYLDSLLEVQDLDEREGKFNQILVLVRDKLEEKGTAVVVGCSLGCEEYFNFLDQYGFLYYVSSATPNGKDLRNCVRIEFRSPS
jgi:hypothetical protein